MKADPYNFRKPSRLAGELEQQLVAWLSSGLAVVTEKWSQQLAAPVEQSLAGLETVRPAEALADLTDNMLAYRITVGPAAIRTLAAIPRPLLLTLVAGVLGDACAELCPDRGLTAVEESLVEYLLQQILGAIRESWPRPESLSIELEGAEPTPRRTRIFNPEDNLIRFSLMMRGSFGEHTWHWLAPKQELAALAGQPADGPGAVQDSTVRARLETLVGGLPLNVSVRLGQAVMHVSELAGLQSGDLVLLDQPVSRPLTASVAGQTRFLVWPGRVGAKQAIQIESRVES